MPAESRRTPPRGPRPGARPGPRRSGGAGRGGRPPASPTASTTAAAAGAASAPRGGGDRGRRPRRSRFTGRAAVLVLVLSLLTISYASSLRAYLQQRSHIGDLQGQIALREAEIHDLEREKQRWEDPAFVRQQARDLNFVMPGETAYVVLDDDGKPVDGTTTLTDPSTIARKKPTAWWSNAWRSVETAGHPPKRKPGPATEIDGSGG